MKQDKGELWSSPVLASRTFHLLSSKGSTKLNLRPQGLSCSIRFPHWLSWGNYKIHQLRHTGLGTKYSRKKCWQKRNTEGWLATELTPFYKSETLSGRTWDTAQLKAAELRITAAKNKSHSATCQLLGVLTSQPQHYFNTVLMLGQLSYHLHREVDSTVTTFSGNICRTQQHFWTCSFSGTLPVDLPWKYGFCYNLKTGI